MSAVAFKEVSKSAERRLESCTLGRKLTGSCPMMPKESYDSSVGRREVKEVGPPIKNKVDGCLREGEVGRELERRYPANGGYSVTREQYLRNRDGSIAKDPLTGTARRIDFGVIRNGKVVDCIEVTSPTASKLGQYSKEMRIREAGGNYIKANDGNLVRIPNNVQTRIERRA